MSRRMKKLLVFTACLCAVTVSALDNGLGDLPPLGFNSWNVAHCSITEALIRSTVDALASKGFLDHGYSYVNLDDCWMSTERSPDGNLQWDPIKFPTGDTLGAYIHSKGFKFGMYLSAGVKTCSLRDPTNRSAVGWGSYGYETADAAWIAAQGADYLKYDGVCAVPACPSGYNRSFTELDWQQVIVARMGVALNATGRPVWYQYGSPYTWARAGAPVGLSWITSPNASDGGLNSFRSGFDMADNYGNAIESIGLTTKYARGHCSGNKPCDGPGSWADADCLEIGNNVTKINEVQSQSYFSWYAIANAPLLISTIISELSPELIRILQNDEVIAINQDYAGRVGEPVTSPMSVGGTVWAKPLSLPKGAIAALLVSSGHGQSSNGTVFWNDVGLDPSQAMKVRDPITHEDLGVFTGQWSAPIDQSKGETRLIVLTPPSAKRQ